MFLHEAWHYGFTFLLLSWQPWLFWGSLRVNVLIVPELCCAELCRLHDPENQSSWSNRGYNQATNDVHFQPVEPRSTSVNLLLWRKQCGQCRTLSSGCGLLPVCVYCAQSSTSNARFCCCEVQNDVTKPMRHINYHCTNTFHILQFLFFLLLEPFWQLVMMHVDTVVTGCLWTNTSQTPWRRAAERTRKSSTRCLLSLQFCL